MERQKEENQEAFSVYLTKEVFLTKRTNKKFWYYSGTIIKVTDSFIVIEDFKVGQVIVSFEDISSIELKGGDDK